jgi:hypothetical protein
MKFYKDREGYYYLEKIEDSKLNAICIDSTNIVRFLKNGKRHNDRNYSYIEPNRFKVFYLNGKMYGFTEDFTKQTWRRFVKLQAFL